MTDKKLNYILCVDDDHDILEVTRLCLEMVGGFEVATSYSGVDALTKALNRIPDLIMVDVMMPDMDGPTTYKFIRQKKELAHVPVIFMTARIRKQEVEEYLSLGAAGVIAKPFDPMKLSAEVSDIWRKINE